MSHIFICKAEIYNKQSSGKYNTKENLIHQPSDKQMYLYSYLEKNTSVHVVFRKFYLFVEHKFFQTIHLSVSLHKSFLFFTMALTKGQRLENA